MVRHAPRTPLARDLARVMTSGTTPPACGLPDKEPLSGAAYAGLHFVKYEHDGEPVTKFS